jgi:hypothetical protein
VAQAPRRYAGARDLVQLDVGKSLSQRLRRLGTQSRDEHTGPTRRDVRRDLRDLRGGLSRAVYDFWKALPERAVMIDRREAQ